MATVTQFSNKKVLIIDDMPEVRSQLQMTLTSIGFEKLHSVGTVKEALDKISVMDYQVIVCDYNLGNATNGQQFLEYMRMKEKLPRNSIFFMVTAENSYEKVVAAAEHMPDDYLLKPFTAAHFITRLDLMLERQTALEKINSAYDKKNWTLAVEECNKLLAEKNKYYIEICKIKADALIHAELTELAIEVYEEILRLRDLPWAKLALARLKAKLGLFDEAQEMMNNLIEENPQFLASYDFSSDLLLQQNRPDEAMEVLEMAMKKNPGNLNRTRNYAGMALSKGDFATAERVLRENIKTHKHSPVRDASDYSMLSRALVEQGNPDDAIETLEEAGRFFKDEASEVILAASSSVAWLRSGDVEKAEQGLQKALASDYRTLPANVATSLAEACYAAGKEDAATNLLKQVLQNNPGDLKLQGKVKMLQVMAGKSIEESSALIQDSAKEVIKINNEGVLKAKEGKYEEAVELVISAAERLPQNLNIISNAAMIIAVALTKTTFDRALLDKCLIYRQRVFELNPQHPKLPKIDAMLETLKAAA